MQSGTPECRQTSRSSVVVAQELLELYNTDNTHEGDTCVWLTRYLYRNNSGFSYFCSVSDGEDSENDDCSETADEIFLLYITH